MGKNKETPVGAPNQLLVPEDGWRMDSIEKSVIIAPDEFTVEAPMEG